MINNTLILMNTRLIQSFSKNCFTYTIKDKSISTITSYCYDNCEKTCIQRCRKKSQPIDIPKTDNSNKSKNEEFELFTQEELDLLENPNLKKEIKKYDDQEHWRQWRP